MYLYRRSAQSPYRFLPLIALAFVVSLAGCGHGGVSRWKLHAQTVRPERNVVVLLVDGLPPRLVERGCREGWMPNIERRFMRNGVRATGATTCVPSITYAAIGTLLTGVGPAEHGVIGNRWFDPQRALFRDYATIRHYRTVNADLHTPLVFEQIAPMRSASVQAAHNRGVSMNVANWALSGAMWFFRDYTAVDKLTATSVWRVANWANRTGQWPELVLFYFPGLDSIGHVHGADSEKFRRAAMHIDHQVGRVFGWLEREGLLESTSIMLVSDHGMVDASSGGHINLIPLLREDWHRTVTDHMIQDAPETQRRAYYDQFDTVCNWRDGRRVSIHFRGNDGWQTPIPPDALARLLARPPPEQRLWHIPGIDVVAYRDTEGCVVLRRARAEARIHTHAPANRRDGPRYAYQPVHGDVFGYDEHPRTASFIRSGPRTFREWLAATAETDYPGVVPRIADLMTLRAAGDVVLFAAPGYSFVQEIGGHGGLHRDEMRMTFMLTGPGVEPGIAHAPAAIDVVATIRDLLEIEGAIDNGRHRGQSILRHTEPVEPRSQTDTK